MADFVLVHGAWHGAWCWKRILPGLWSAGHRAFAVTLTGVGERAHARNDDIRQVRPDRQALAGCCYREPELVIGHRR